MNFIQKKEYISWKALIFAEIYSDLGNYSSALEIGIAVNFNFYKLRVPQSLFKNYSQQINYLLILKDRFNPPLRIMDKSLPQS